MGQPLKFKDILNLAAPHSWPASVAPAVIAMAISFHRTGQLDPLLAACLVVIVILMQSAVNAFDDYADYLKGTDTLENSPDAFDAVIVYGMQPRTARNLGFLFLLLAAIPAVYVVWSCGLVPLAIGLAGALIIFCYAFGKTPISYLPVGELFSGLAMGGLVPLAGVQMLTGRLDFSVLLEALPSIIGIGLILFSNNGCDIARDRVAGRRTLACLLGPQRTRKCYRIALWIWLVCPFVVLAVQGRWSGGLIYALGCLTFMHLLIRQTTLPLGPESRRPVMGGITTLVSLICFAYAFACAVGA